MSSNAGEPPQLQIGADQHLTIDRLVGVARDRRPVAGLTAAAERLVRESADWVRTVVQEIDEKQACGAAPDPYYGINTGFGALAGKTALASEYLTRVLSRNLIASHSVGVGEYFDEEVVRATMLIRAHSLAQGYSGVRREIIDCLVAMLNAGVYPAVPAKGSLGASGDLAPLAHLALTICTVPTGGSGDPALGLDETDGEAFVPHSPEAGQTARSAQTTYHLTQDHRTGAQLLWRRVPGEEAMAGVGGKIELRAKEGLALINGATFSAAIAALAVHDAWTLVKHAELALAMTLEAIRGFRDPFFPEVHRVRAHAGAGVAAAAVLRYVRGSALLDPGDVDTKPQRVPPQDPYSVRCAPQVLGAVRDTLAFVQQTVEIELNSATDNPLIFLELPRAYKTVSCGNFHGEPLAMAMDFLGIAVTELGSIAERRVFKLNDYVFPLERFREFSARERGVEYGPLARSQEIGLPGFLLDDDPATRGLNTGLMMLQATAAALVSDCKTLAHPDSVDSIPSSADQEDHVSMSLNAARHAREIVENVESVVAIELMSAAQALLYRLDMAHQAGTRVALGAGTTAALDCLRDAGLPYVKGDPVFYPYMRKVVGLMRSQVLIDQADRAAAQGVVRQ